jgi:predicted DNA-binding protein (MmcQ/YjbR family)
MSNYEIALKKLRATCLALPEVTETTTWGHPTFRAGRKTFAVLEEYDGCLTLAVNVGFDRQAELLADDRFIETPYIGHRGWVSLKLDRQTNWDEVRNLALESYHMVALKRMLRVLDQNRGVATQ